MRRHEVYIPQFTGSTFVLMARQMGKNWLLRHAGQWVTVDARTATKARRAGLNVRQIGGDQ